MKNLSEIGIIYKIEERGKYFVGLKRYGNKEVILSISQNLEEVIKKCEMWQILNSVNKAKIEIIIEAFCQHNDLEFTNNFENFKIFYMLK